MPPSPAMRNSPGRELRADNHKRGRSLEGGLLFREKDDDLALFNEVQIRERDNFLLQSNDDFEDTFSTKLRYFMDHKLGISIPVRGESSDLLNADGGKNDYDWLLTPPDTPLFPSLDEEAPPVNIARRGRPRSQPISISRSSTMEKSYRSSRGSASPNRSSPSPRSGNSTFQARGRAFSACQSSPTPSSRHATPSRRSSPPPSKPSTPPPKLSAPAPRRMSTGSSGSVASSGVRGISPVKTSRGNSASPKVRAWQSNISGFSSEAPPNLRTSLADRPASYVRGFSPASRNGRDSSSKYGRQSMSPTASRSVSSSYSHDRDRFSPHSKGSVASSGDDDVDSLQSTPVGSLDRSSTRRVGSIPNIRAQAFSKKPSRTISSSSAPKRSFDLALRQMDHRKGPQNMFRPLLSNVPSSTFYTGKASSAHHAIISRNSSVTTSSNASSDQAISATHDTEGSEQNQEDVTSACVKSSYQDSQDEVFFFDKTDVLNENRRHGTQDGSLSCLHSNFNGGHTVDSRVNASENLSEPDTAMLMATTTEALDSKGASLDVDAPEDMVLCSNCGRYCTIESMEGDLKLCPECRRSGVLLAVSDAVKATTVGDKSPRAPTKLEDRDSVLVPAPESPRVIGITKPRAGEHESFVKESQTSYSEPIWNFLSANSQSRTLVEEGGQRNANQQVVGQSAVTYGVPDGETGGQQLQQAIIYPVLKVDASEGTGISVLLKRSSSGKGPVLRSRSFTASSNSYDDPSNAKDSANSIRSSIGHGSVSASSSVDLGSYRQTETRVQRQLSGRKSDLETYRFDMNAKHRRSGSSLSGTSNHAFQPLSFSTSTLEESVDISLPRVQNDPTVTLIDTEEQFMPFKSMEVDDTCTDIESNPTCRTIDASTSELSSHIQKVHPGDSLMTSVSNSEEFASLENVDDLANTRKHILDVEATAMPTDSCTVEEESMPSYCIDRVDVAEFPDRSSLDKVSEIESEDPLQGSPGTQFDGVSSSSNSSIDELRESHAPTTSVKDMIDLLTESDNSDHEQGALEESTVRSKARSLTVEEARDTIDFCRSIIHDIAYEAATIALEKETPDLLEGSRPMVTILGKPNSDRKDPRSRTAVKRNSKSQKARQRRVETEANPPSNTKNDEKTNASPKHIVGVHNNDSMKPPPPKLESKCNCTIM